MIISPPSCRFRVVIGFFLLFWGVAGMGPLRAQSDTPASAVYSLGDAATGQGWSGFGAANWLSRILGKTSTVWELPGSISFEVPSGSKGWWQHGFRQENDGTINGLDYSGLWIRCQTDRESPVQLKVTVRIPPQPGRLEYLPQASATVRVAGAGMHRLYIPWSGFDFQQAQPAFLKFIQKIEITGSYADGGSGSMKLSSVALTRGETVALSAAVRSRAVAQPGKVIYPVTVFNCTEQPQSIVLSLQRHGWEALPAQVMPDHLDLAPGASGSCQVEVTVTDRFPVAAQEKQVLRAVANGQGEASLEFITAHDVAHPYLLHTAARWAEVRDKVKKYEWARLQQQRLVNFVRQWQVPEMADPAKLKVTDGMGPYLFTSDQAHRAKAAAIAWQLVRDRAFAEKAALFLRRVSDPVSGYASTLRGSQQGLVHEGEVFASMAMAYDMILDADVLTADDKGQIEKTFRLLIGTMDVEAKGGGISNWNVDEMTGALYCSLMIGDLERAWRFFEGPGGTLDQLGKGVMDDGWWYECSVNYNSGMAHAFTEVAVAVQPWGIDLMDMKVPAGNTPNYALVPWASQPGLFGMAFEKWGPNTRSYRQVRDLWDGFLPFVDYRGIIFGTNDSDEKKVSGDMYELPYYIYRDPKYAGMIKFSSTRDLLWGVPDLPDKTPEFFRESAVADNAGMAVLRSQKPGRPPREQIQAVLKYGTHGGYHGHFDRASLQSLMRYGRSFFHPEMAWYGYITPLYKFYGQTSISKNMVVVDQKMQEPVECQRLLFHTGPLLQAVAMENRPRWSNPPFMGGMLPGPGQTYEDLNWQQSHWLPVPKDAPSPLVVTGYTEPILQRRLMAVTDDYVVLADYLKADQEHTFDNLLQIKGFLGIDAPEKKLVRHAAHMNPDPLGSSQLITNCDWYDVQGPARARFAMMFGAPGEISSGLGERNEPGPLKMDVYSAWPESREIMVGTAPENLKGGGRKLQYEVRVDGQALARGRFGAWVMGEGDVDVAVNGSSVIELQVQSESRRERNTFFWTNPRIVTADGREIPIPAEAIHYENTLPAPMPGLDYEGGPIEIAGTTYATALPAEPQDLAHASVVRIDLKNLGAVRFKAVVGGDYPTGDESQRRKTFSVRTTGKEAQFLTVIEPYESKSMVQSVKASGPDQVTIVLKDGRTQRLTLQGLEAGTPSVLFEEFIGEKVVRTETASPTVFTP